MKILEIYIEDYDDIINVPIDDLRLFQMKKILFLRNETEQMEFIQGVIGEEIDCLPADSSFSDIKQKFDHTLNMNSLILEIVTGICPDEIYEINLFDYVINTQANDNEHPRMSEIRRLIEEGEFIQE